MILKRICLISISLVGVITLYSQPVSKVWVARNGNGTYKNPILNAGYSDYSYDDKNFNPVNEAPFNAKSGRRAGAKTDLYSSSQNKSNDAGYSDFDGFRVEALQD